MTKTISALQRNILTLAALFAASFITLLLVLPFQAEAALIAGQLDIGDSGSDVTSLQTFLAGNSSIYPEGLITGYYGALTASAVSRFQTANGLPSVGRVGPLTRDLINAQMGGGQPSNPSPTGDVSAPIMNPEAVSVTSNSATVSWTTSESARSRVMYGTSWPFLYATAPSVSTNGFGSTANITITGLQSHTTYFYVRESIDDSGNIMWTVGKPLTTQ